jgi:poly(3-hydroxybutyrate) depolymerase
MILRKKSALLCRLRVSAFACQLFAGLSSLLALPASADWLSMESIASHDTWIYNPNAYMAGSKNKHGLLLVLHGCSQHASDLKDHGNLTNAAEKAGLVLALPEVGMFDRWGMAGLKQGAVGDLPHWWAGCWDYDGAQDKQAHIQELSQLATTLINRQALQINSDHVYVVGLSSGGALSLLLGCASPEIFAGIGAIAGPSVGSKQEMAVADSSQIPEDNKANAVIQCKSMASRNSTCLKSQIANIGYGDMDRNGPNERYNWPGFNIFDREYWNSHPGQYKVASVEWSEQNVDILKQVYAISGPEGKPDNVEGGKGTEWPATNEPTRLAKIVVHNVGHAWPAGKAEGGGAWIARNGLDYPSYITNWLIKHNVRAGKPKCTTF